MLRKSTLLAVAATAALGLAMFNISAADAKGGHGGGHGGGHHGGMHRGHGGHFGGKHIGGGRHFGGHRHGHFRRAHFRHHHRWYKHRHYVRWQDPIVYSTPVVYGVAKPAVAGPCTCLSKEYTQEGAVLFKDNCTNEAAMNPPALSPTAEVAPQQ